MENTQKLVPRRGNGLFSISCLSTSVFVAYIAYVAYNMHGVMNPLRHVTIGPDDPTLKPLWAEGTKMTATCYLAASKKFHWEFRDRSHPNAARVPLVASAESLTFDHGMIRHSFDLNISAVVAGLDETAPNVTMLTNPDWTALMSNKTLYFHVVVEAEMPADSEGEEGMWTLVGSVPLVKYGPKPKARPLRKLLSDFTGSGRKAEDSKDDKERGIESGSTGKSSASALRRKGDYMSFWKPEVAVRLVTDFTEYPQSFLPQTIQRASEILWLNKDGHWAKSEEEWYRLAYKPILHADEIGLTSDKYVPLNRTLSSLALKVTMEPMSLQRWNLMQVMEESLQHQKESFGFQDSDVDDVRRLISDTNVYLLAITLLASTLHLLFEFLAFKSDVDFWRKNKSLRGLSVRALFMEVMFQTVILLSLIEEDASLLVTVPAGVGVLIQMWKVRRATGMQIGWKGVVFTRLQQAEEDGTGGENKVLIEKYSTERKETGTSDTDTSNLTVKPSQKKTNGGTKVKGDVTGERLWAARSSKRPSSGKGIVAEGANTLQGAGGRADQAQETMQYDRIAIIYLSLLLLPLVFGFSAKKLIMDEHAGWYSWALQSLTAFVYTFGFVLMTPQLYINYKLKSVAHLPWRFLCYRSLNTVIDDLFAFVIRMPAMHRLSCFRDDVVFVIYLYQRWIYPVDTSRPQDRGA